MKLKTAYEKLYNAIFTKTPFNKLLKIPGVEKLLQYETVSYLVFGVLTTVVNFAVFALANAIMGEGSETKVLFTVGSFNFKWLYLSNAIAWVCAVAFAFVTNKLFVFESRGHELKTVIREATSFAAARLLSFILFEELLFGVLLIPLEHVKGGEWVAKIIAAVLVVIFNYVAGKFVIFKKRGEK